MATEKQQTLLNDFSAKSMDMARKCWYPRYAKKQKNLQPKEVADEAAKYHDISQSEAFGWLNGHSFPNEEQCENFMLAITKNNDWRDNAHLLLAGNALLDLRDELQEAFGNAPPPPMTETQMLEALMPKRKIEGRGGNNSVLTFYDTIGLEPRQHPDLVAGKANPRRYENLPKDTLKDIQAKTKNLPEFLTVSRLLKTPAMTHDNLADTLIYNKIKSSNPMISGYEIGHSKSGTRIPSLQTLRVISAILFEGDLLPVN